MPIEVDGRNKFSVPANFPAGSSTGTLSVEIFGGPLARVQAALFGADDKPITGIGFDPFPPPITTEKDGRASWLFELPAGAAYIKWGVQAVRSAASLSNYSVTAKVRSADGTPLVVSQFSALLDDKAFSDPIIYDGADIVHSGFAAAAIPGGNAL